MCLYVADPATFLASSSVLGSYFPLREARLFTYGKKEIYLSLSRHLVNIVDIKILSLKCKNYVVLKSLVMKKCRKIVDIWRIWLRLI